jgi:hypothetical protein
MTDPLFPADATRQTAEGLCWLSRYAFNDLIGVLAQDLSRLAGVKFAVHLTSPEWNLRQSG